MVLVCLITAPSIKSARQIASRLLDLRLAACVNIMKAESHFVWKSKLEKTPEWLLIVKTAKNRFKSLKKTVEKMHPYEVPEIIALPVAAGNAPYLNWVRESVHARGR